MYHLTVTITDTLSHLVSLSLPRNRMEDTWTTLSEPPSASTRRSSQSTLPVEQSTAANADCTTTTTSTLNTVQMLLATRPGRHRWVMYIESAAKHVPQAYSSTHRRPRTAPHIPHHYPQRAAPHRQHFLVVCGRAYLLRSNSASHSTSPNGSWPVSTIMPVTLIIF
jgi:hypothetical protein